MTSEEVVDQSGEQVDDLGVEVPAALPHDVRDDAVDRQRPSVGAVAGHRVEDVCQRGDPALDRDARCPEALRVAVAVPPLVVGQCRRGAERHHG